MKKILSFFTMILTACCLHAASIYVVDQTGWNELHLYSYINDTQGLHGKWPGATAARTETINGVECPVWNFSPEKAGEYFLIFNNGNGAQIKNDFQAFELRDYYLIVTTQGCTEISRDDIEPAPLPNPIEANNIIIYEANEKVFASSKCFNAIDARLDAIADLGVNVLWLMPIHPIGSKNSVGSPYCVRDYKGVNASYGSLDDFKNLVKDAHAKNMRVIIDWVANHTAWDHAWVSAHPDWYTEAQTGDEKNWNDVTFLNYSKSEVREAMKDAMLYWVNQGVDGFRCDYAQGVPDDFWAEAIAAIRAVKPDAIMLAETSRLQLFEAGFDWMYSWDYLGAIQNLYPGKRTLAQLYSTHDKEMSSTPEGHMRMRYITNHDACSERANKELYINTDGMLSAACLTYFLGGIPLIYSSQEVGYLEKINFFSFVSMNWNANSSYQTSFKKLMSVYRETAMLRGGQQQRLVLGDKVALITYASSAGTLVVLVNTANSAQTVPLPSSLQGLKFKNCLTDSEQTLPSSLQLGALEYRIYSLPLTTDLESVGCEGNRSEAIGRDAKGYDMLGRPATWSEANGVFMYNGKKILR